MKKLVFILSGIVFFGLPAFSQSYTSVKSWLTDLSSNDTVKRFGAALALDSLSGNKESQFRELIGALKNPDPFVRQYVCYTIGTLQYKPEVSIPLLIRQFRDDDKKVRQYACVATAMYGDKAIKYLLDSLQTNRGPLDEDGPANWYYSEDSAKLEQSWKSTKSGTKEPGSLHYLLTRTSYYSIFCLRMLEGDKVKRSASVRTAIPSAFKNVLVAYDEPENSYGDNRVNEFPIPPIHQLDTSEQVKLVEKLLTAIDSPYVIRTRRGSRILEERIYYDSSNIVGYNILLTHPYLVKLYPGNLFACKQDHLLMALTVVANSGSYGLRYLPELLSMMKNMDGAFRIKAYLAAGYILTNNYHVYFLKDFFTAIDLRQLNYMQSAYDPFIFAEVSPFYIINKTGLTDTEISNLQVGKYFFDNMAVAADLDKLNYYISINHNNAERRSVNDSLLNAIVRMGLQDTISFINTMAFNFSKYLGTYDEGLKQLIAENLANKNYLVQEAAVEAAIEKNMLPSFSENMMSRLMINRLITGRFHSEQRQLFGGEGSEGIGGWGAGGSGPASGALSFWPPAPSTCRGTIDISGLYGAGTLGDINLRLTNYLEASGYKRDFYRYFEIEQGFALMTNREQISQAGIPLTTGRWSKETQGGFFEILRRGNIGDWRTITFVITQKPNFQDNGSPFKNLEGNENLYHSGDVNPPKILTSKCKDYYLHVLIYHFTQKNGGVRRQYSKLENKLSVYDHLNSLKIPSRF